MKATVIRVVQVPGMLVMVPRASLAGQAAAPRPVWVAGVSALEWAWGGRQTSAAYMPSRPPRVP